MKITDYQPQDQAVIQRYLTDLTNTVLDDEHSDDCPYRLLAYPEISDCECDIDASDIAAHIFNHIIDLCPKRGGK